MMEIPEIKEKEKEKERKIEEIRDITEKGKRTEPKNKKVVGRINRFNFLGRKFHSRYL